MPYLRNRTPNDEAKNPTPGGLLSGYVAQSYGPFGAAGGVSGTGAQGSGPTATGHVNFDSIYAANQGTANHMANQLGNQVQGDVQGAKTGLSNLQQAYGADLTKGAGAAPSAEESNWAQYGSAGVEQPGTVEQAYWAPQGQTGSAAQSRVTEANPGLRSESTKGGGGSSSDAADASTPRGRAPVERVSPRDNPGDYGAQVRAGANATYNGPDSLQQMKGYGGLLDQYTKAQKELGASGIGSDAGIQALQQQQGAGPYVEGGSRLDAALTGQAGRPAFAQLAQQNQDLGSQLGDAVTASQAQSQMAKAKAQQNASAYQGLLDQYTGRQGTDQANADTQTQANAQKIAAAKQQAAQQDWENLQPTSDPSTWNTAQWVRNIGTALSPVDMIAAATGNKGPIDYSTDYFENQYGPIGGSPSISYADLMKRKPRTG